MRDGFTDDLSTGLEPSVFLKARQAMQRLTEVLQRFRQVAVCYSGGKDSTLVTHLMLQAMSRMDGSLPEAHVLLVDTGVEIPRVAEQARAFIARVSAWATAHRLPVRCHVLSPDPNESFWVLLLGKGYPAPAPWFRWCVKRLKINPVRRYLSSLAEEVVVLLGSRRDESESRKRSIDLRRDDDYWMPFEGVPHARAFLPILDWSAAEVWEFLLKAGPLWGGHYRELFGLYWDALDECMFRPSDRAFSCNGRRFGCWTCTVVKRDQTMRNLALAGDETLVKLLAFKERLREVSRNPSMRMGVTRQGRPGPGPLTLDARRELLQSLKLLEDEIGVQLISDSEEKVVRVLWESDALREPGNKVEGEPRHGDRGSS